MPTKKVMKMFGGVSIFKTSIETKTKRLLKDPVNQKLLRSAHISGTYHELFNTWLETMLKGK